MKNKKQLVLNILMIVAIIAIVSGGILIAGYTKGWFGENKNSPIKCSDVLGVTNIERNGVSYTLKKGNKIVKDDIISSNKYSKTTFVDSYKTIYTLNEKSKFVVKEIKDDLISLQIKNGEFFFNSNSNYKLEFDSKKLETSKAVFSVDVYKGSQTVNVYKGKVKVYAFDKVVEIKEGNSVLINDKDKKIYENKLSVSSLNEFLIEQIKTTLKTSKLCFTEEKLKTVLDERCKQKESDNKVVNSSKSVSEKESKKTSNVKDINDKSKSSSKSKKSSNTTNNKKDDSLTCTITIRCDTILNNMQNLTKGKDVYVPRNGTILKTMLVTFKEGQTVFDVLKKVCNSKNIQLEYSWTPMYNSNYIEGINHLYEFDCGSQSGWMYKVNGWFPNYGCSVYELKDGDNIVFIYTCNGLGADVGCSVG